MPKRTVKARIDAFRVRAYVDPLELQTRLNASAERGEAIVGLLTVPGMAPQGRRSEIWLITKGFKLVDKEIDIPDVIEPSDATNGFALKAKG